MATNRVLQLLRSNQIYANFTAAKNAIEGLTGHKDGEILLARYISSAAGAQTTTYETAIGVYAGSVGSDPNTTTVNHWTVFKSSTELDAAIQALQDELDATQAGAGLGTDGSYTAPTSGQNGYEILGGDNAPANLKEAVMKVADYVYDTIAAMNYSLNVNGTADSATTLTKANASKVISAINQTDGQIAAGTTDAKDLLLTGYSKTSDSGSIAGTDTVETALSKLENATAAGTKISSQTGNQLHYLSTAPTDGLATQLSIAPLSAAEIAALSDGSNVREAYKLVDLNASDATAGIGDPIKIYKDSSLTDVFLGTTTDTLSVQGTTYNRATDITPGSGDDSLNFVYHLEDGTYSLSTVNVEAFLQESEFGNGLQADSSTHVVSVKAYDGITVDANGVSVKAGNGLVINSTSKDVDVNPGNGIEISSDAVAVKIDTASEKDSQDTPADFLTVGADGVKVQGIKNEIDRKINALDGTATASTVAAGTDTTPTGDFCVLTKVGEEDGVVQEVAASGTYASKSVLLKKVAATGAAADVSYDNSTAQMADSPATVQAAIDKLDSRIDALGTDALESVTSANAGIAVGTKSNHSQELTLTLDDSTVGTGSELTGTNNALTITDDGLFLSNIWDCGTY